MSERIKLNVPLNRVEGDLEVRVELEDDVVADARCVGTLYRGFENILVGRGALDGLVLTPRICGICSVSHAVAAALALDDIAGVRPPQNGVLVRNLALMAEQLQSDVRHTFLMFAADLTNPAHREAEGYAEAVRRYAPLKGTTAVETLAESRGPVEVIQVLCGQWPHAAFAVPGGVATVPSDSSLRLVRRRLARFRAWYERRVLGDRAERVAALETTDELETWLNADPAHAAGELGFLLRFGRELGLDRLGRGPGNLISLGSLPVPPGSSVAPAKGSDLLVPAGFRSGARLLVLEPDRLAEHVSHSWYDDQPGGRSPATGRTRPYASGDESRKYSWAKAPRYDSLPAETGPLAEMVVGRVPLFTDLVGHEGPSVLVRQLARLLRPARLLPVMEAWLDEIDPGSSFYQSPGRVEEGSGWGALHATRGALGHWVSVENGTITHYQVVAPTTWNASPRDTHDNRGPMEEALTGTRVADPDNPIELGHVVRSFDPCLVCTVHAVAAGDHGDGCARRIPVGLY